MQSAHDNPSAGEQVAGTLFIVATPIGNLADITERAVQILRDVDTLFVEDTRHSQKLLQHLGINRRMVSLHEHNEKDRIQLALTLLADGRDAAIISDAGTPLVSDPGYRLVAACLEHGLRVSPAPGACAAIAALSVAGQATDRFLFCGFPPARQQARLAWLETLVQQPATLVLYESRHRIVDTLQAIVAVFGPHRSVSLAREMTKQFETVVRLPAADLCRWALTDENRQRGEFVLIIAGAEFEAVDTAELDRVLMILLANQSVKEAAGNAAKICRVRKNLAYQRALDLSSLQDT